MGEGAQDLGPLWLGVGLMNTVTPIHGHKIALGSGGYFDFTKPDAKPILIDDIALGLSNTCRFGGQCKQFYSVAEHCWLMSYLVDEAHAWDALMHDAAEALIGDIPKPLKMLLPDYQRLEREVEAAIADQFSVSLPLPDAVKHADLAMLAAEQKHVMKNGDDWQSAGGVEPPQVTFEFWRPYMARYKFLKRFNELLTEGIFP